MWLIYFNLTFLIQLIKFFRCEKINFSKDFAIHLNSTNKSNKLKNNINNKNDDFNITKGNKKPDRSEIKNNIKFFIFSQLVPEINIC